LQKNNVKEQVKILRVRESAASNILGGIGGKKALVTGVKVKEKKFLNKTSFSLFKIPCDTCLLPSNNITRAEWWYKGAVDITSQT
jgi:hypothetical protein